MVKVKINAKLSSPKNTPQGRNGFHFLGAFEMELNLQQIANLINGYSIEINLGPNIELKLSNRVLVESDKLVIEMFGYMKQDSPEIRRHLVFLGWVAC